MRLKTSSRIEKGKKDCWRLTSCRRPPLAVRLRARRDRTLRRHLSHRQRHPPFRSRVYNGSARGFAHGQPLPLAQVAHVLVRIELGVFVRSFPRGAFCVVMRVNAVVIMVAASRHEVPPLVRDFEPDHAEPRRQQGNGRECREQGRFENTHGAKVFQRGHAKAWKGHGLYHLGAFSQPMGTRPPESSTFSTCLLEP